MQTDLPHAKMRSNSLDVVGDMLAVAYQTSSRGHAARRLRALRHQRRPKSRSSSRISTARARIRAACTRCGSSTARPCTWRPARRTSSRATRRTTSSTASSTCAIPRKPAEVGRWWYPGTRDGDDAPPPPRLARKFDAGFRAHNTNVYPAAAGPRVHRLHRRRRDHPRHRRPSRPEARVATGAIRRRSTASRTRCCRCFEPRPADRQRRVRPGRRRRLAEARVGRRCAARDQPVPIATLPAPPHDAFAKRGGRFGAHNLHENLPVPTRMALRDASSSARSSTPACARTTCPTRTSRQRSRTSCPARRSCRRRARCS